MTKYNVYAPPAGSVLKCLDDPFISYIEHVSIPPVAFGDGQVYLSERADGRSWKSWLRDAEDIGLHCLPRPARASVLVVRRFKTEMPAVLTIGHSTRTWQEFLDLLRAHGVERVIDVRSIPRSRHNPQFNRETLARKLRSARIGYVHLQKLGGLRHTHRDSPNTGWRNSSFRGFADYMQTSEFEAGLHRLIKLAGQKRSAIMCAEAVPWRCHRSLIADALTVRGIRVDDIMSMKRSQVHALTSFARARGHHITYPAVDRGARIKRQSKTSVVAGADAGS